MIDPPLMRVGHQLGLLVGACTLGGLAVASLLWKRAQDLEEIGRTLLQGELLLRDHARVQSLAGHFMTTADMAVSSGSAYLETVAQGQADALNESFRDLEQTGVGARFAGILSELAPSTRVVLDSLHRLISFSEEERESIGGEIIDALDDEMIHVQLVLDQVDSGLQGEVAELREQRKRGEASLQGTALLAGCLYLVGIVVAWRWSVRSTIHPLLRLARSAEVASQGGGKFVVSGTHEQGPEEVRILSRSLEIFASGLQSAHDTLEEKVRSRTAELHEANGKLEGEILQRIRADQEARKLENELRQAQKLESIGQLAAGIAHEINTPIQFVSDSMHFVRDSFGELQVLLSKYTDLRTAVAEDRADPELAAAVAQLEEELDLSYVLENAPKALDRSLEGLDRVATIVRSMKEFAHPDQKEKMPIDLNRAIQSTLTIARNEYKQVAEVETDFGEIPPVNCHGGGINQAVLNILVNAAHAITDVVRGTDKRGRITVRTRLEGDDVVISISDTGGGIPENARERIFDPFFTTKEVGKGTGQGLAIARSVLVDKHGGSLTFETTMGQGTTFYLRLPVSDRALATEAA